MEQTVPREKWLYNDRGMMKWMGWLLSDHSSFMEGEQQHEQLKPVAPEMAPSLIDVTLNNAFEQSQTVQIQLNLLENDQYAPAITGEILGYHDDRIYLQAIHGPIQVIILEEIRCVLPQPEKRGW